MRAWSLVRYASVLAAVHALAHGAGSLARGASRGPEEAALFDAMRGFTFDAMGATVSHFDFYVGYELLLGAGILFQAALLWQLGSLSRDEPGRARPLIAICTLFYAVFVGLYSVYFFAGPILLATSVLVCLALAWLFSPTDEPW